MAARRLESCNRSKNLTATAIGEVNRRCLQRPTLSIEIVTILGRVIALFVAPWFIDGELGPLGDYVGSSNVHVGSILRFSQIA
jgi:hypothetical protein